MALGRVTAQKKMAVTESTSQNEAMPPYVSLKTFYGFLESLKIGVPARIDKTLMSTMSGAVQSQLMGALRYLKLVTDNGSPLPLLKELVTATDADRPTVIRIMLEGAYPFLRDSEFPIKTATTGALEEKFREGGVTGDTTRKCLSFFVAMSKDAEMEISPHIKSTHANSSGSNSRRRAKRVVKSKESSTEDLGKTPFTPPAKQETTIQIVAGKLPAFDPTWETGVQQSWLAAFDKWATIMDKLVVTEQVAQKISNDESGS